MSPFMSKRKTLKLLVSFSFIFLAINCNANAHTAFNSSIMSFKVNNLKSLAPLPSDHKFLRDSIEWTDYSFVNKKEKIKDVKWIKRLAGIRH